MNANGERRPRKGGIVGSNPSHIGTDEFGSVSFSGHGLGQPARRQHGFDSHTIHQYLERVFV